MKVLSKRITAVLLILLLVIMSIVLVSCEAGESRVYIAVGDSVPAGFGVPVEEGYVSLLYEMLKSEKLADVCYNYAENGYTTTMLLEFLNGIEDPQQLEQFENASVITINIGGNNILRPFLNYLPDIDELRYAINELTVFLAGSKDTLMQSIEIISQAGEIFNDFTVRDIMELISFIQKTAPMLEDVTQVLDNAVNLKLIKYIPLLMGSFPVELEAELNKSIDTFATGFEEIISWINTNAPDATVIVNTVYNPIMKDAFGIFDSIYTVADVLTQSLNSIIFQGKENGGYLVSDVYSRFNDEANITNLLNADFDMAAMTLNFDIIHPNSNGHKLIARLNYEAIMMYFD